MTSAGMLHIIEPFCGGSHPGNPQDDVQWYVVSGTKAWTPGSTPPAGWSSYPPYIFPLAPASGVPNPNNPSLSGHHNITRHWPTAGPVLWRFNVPDLPGGANTNDNLPPGQGLPAGPAQCTDYQNLLLQDVFVTAGAPGGANAGVGYTYGEALWDVAMIFARFSAYTTTPDLPSDANWGSVTWPAGARAPVPFVNAPDQVLLTAPGGNPCPPSGTASQPPMGIPWSAVSARFAGFMYHAPYVLPAGLINNLLYTTAAGGPTGDGLNEICWCSGTLGGGNGAGMTSSLVDPSTGIVTECDVILPAGFTAGWGQGGGPTLANGGFFPYPSGGCWSGGAQGTPSAWSVIPHEIGHFFGLDHTNLNPGAFGPGNPIQTFTPISGAGATIMATATWSDWPLMTQRIFKAADPYPGPCINGRITGVGAFGKTGRASIGSLHPDDVTGMTRLYPVTVPNPLSVVRPLINDVARIEGTILGGTPLQPLFGMNVFPLPSDGSDYSPFNGAVSGTHRLGSSSVVGSANTVGTPLPTSGQFVIPYVDAGQSPPPGSQGTTAAFGSGKAMSLIVEPLQAAGMSGATFAEWWGPGLGGVGGGPFFAVANPLSAFTPFVPPSGVQWSAMGGYKAFATSLGSLFVVHGTVIQTTMIQNQFGPLTEGGSRPVVALDPRTGFTSSAMTITATVRCDFKLASASWIVNGVVKAAGPATVQPNTSGCGPYTYAWVTTAGTLGVSSGTRVQFAAKEAGANCTPNGGTGGLPASFEVGINECYF